VRGAAVGRGRPGRDLLIGVGTGLQRGTGDGIMTGGTRGEGDFDSLSGGVGLRHVSSF
jgi:hypothetical protein